MAKKKKGKKQAKNATAALTTPEFSHDTLDDTFVASEASTPSSPTTHPLLRGANFCPASPLVLPPWHLPLYQSPTSFEWADNCLKALNLETLSNEASSIEQDEYERSEIDSSVERSLTFEVFYEHLLNSQQLCKTLTVLVNRLEEVIAEKNQLLKVVEYSATISREEEAKVKAKRAEELKKQRTDLTAKFTWEIELLKKDLKEKARLLERTEKELQEGTRSTRKNC